MARQRRLVPAGEIVHVTNRGVGRRAIFLSAADYRDFLALLRRGKERFPVSLLAFCLMPNHFHAVIRPDAEGALSAYLHWVLGCYSRHLRVSTGTSGHGHVFQARCWTGPIADDMHFLNVVRYIEYNPVAAGLVARAERWRWGSAWMRGAREGSLLDPPPVQLPPRWLDLVNRQPDPDSAD